MDLAAKLMAAQRPAEAVTEFRKALTYSHDLLLNAIIYGRMADAFRLAGDATNQQDAFAHAQDSYRAALRADPDRTTKLTEQLDNSGFNLSALK
jgi:Tfp pilus assembly protein PilF